MGRERIKLGDSLTLNQEAMLDFIQSYKVENGFAPSVQDIATTLGFASTNSVRKQLDSIERKGYIKRDGTKARALVVLERISADA